MKKLAVLLTCFNRKEKTCKCLESLFNAVSSYNTSNNDEIHIQVFLVDDGCTDGTYDAIREQFPIELIRIIKGTGTLYWAGGMRLAWDIAFKQHNEWNYYLLLNDDTEVLESCFETLLNTEKYCIEKYSQQGIYSGITCSKNEPTRVTYGGNIWVNKFKGTSERLGTLTHPQLCDMTNANILLVPTSVVDAIGRFSEDYQHGMADYDYTIRARSNGVPVLITSTFCGYCENDHTSSDEIAERIINMSLNERRKYFNHPIHSSKDYLKFIRNTSPMRVPIVWIGRQLNLYLPKFYYKLNKSR